MILLPPELRFSLRANDLERRAADRDEKPAPDPLPLVKFFNPLGAVGLATATAVGLWINLGALIGLALARQTARFTPLFIKTLAAAAAAALALLLVAQFGRAPALTLGAHFGGLGNLIALLALGLAGALVYIATLALALRLLGVRLAHLRGGRAR